MNSAAGKLTVTPVSWYGAMKPTGHNMLTSQPVKLYPYRNNICDCRLMCLMWSWTWMEHKWNMKRTWREHVRPPLSAAASHVDSWVHKHKDMKMFFQKHHLWKSGFKSAHEGFLFLHEALKELSFNRLTFNCKEVQKFFTSEAPEKLRKPISAKKRRKHTGLEVATSEIWDTKSG